MTLYDLMIKSGMTDVFDISYDDAIMAYAQSTFIHISFDSERVGILGAERVGDHITIDIDIDG